MKYDDQMEAEKASCRRKIALLMADGRERTIDDVATALGISKVWASWRLRELGRMAIVERADLPCKTIVYRMER